jgi:NADPH:quinone reductase-like Zn-dependent oxidoreductase
MRVYVVRKGSQGLEGLECIDRAQPVPTAGQVLVRVHATSLNYRDQVIATGKYMGRGPLQQDTVPLSDGAGEVVATGADVTRFKVGDRVAGSFFPAWLEGPPTAEAFTRQLGGSEDGMLAEFVVREADAFVRVPGHLSYEEAATLPCAAVTAWNAFFRTGDIKPGDSVLLLGTGGVSLFAVQFAQLAGARVFITSSSDAKLAVARSLGADDLINYQQTPAWDQVVLERTGGRGVDHVIEVGGPVTFARSLSAVRVGGTVTVLGVVAGRDGQANPLPIIGKTIRLQGLLVGSRAVFEDMNRAIDLAQLKPHIDRVFPFAEAADAYRYQLTAQHSGKIVISVV